MAPVYALLESKKLVPELEPSALGIGADRGPAAAGKKRAPADAKLKPKKPKQKDRGILYDDEEGEGETMPHGENHADNGPKVHVEKPQVSFPYVERYVGSLVTKSHQHVSALSTGLP